MVTELTKQTGSCVDVGHMKSLPGRHHTGPYNGLVTDLTTDLILFSLQWILPRLKLRCTYYGVDANLTTHTGSYSTSRDSAMDGYINRYIDSKIY